MHLSKVEIFGFKSFANKTVVDFTRGITGIVGPNGCGKTNIVDAIRWCLGEQKSSTLRSDKMENVIFNGTRTKKPMGMAEVSLTIMNDKGILPTDFSEVTITRRIFRSGESEYLLNKNICRLKDITNLFMDTGMGTNAYSVIELKMIETILSNKAEERRRMFEEAAGVNKYKLRRRLSLNKLDEVKKDLTRVNDIVSEVDKNVKSLERQAKKADRYNQLQTELKELELGLSEREYFLFTGQLENFRNESSVLQNQKEEIDNQRREIEGKLIELRQQISSVESSYREKSNFISQLTEKLFTLNKNISVSQERTKSLNNNIERFERNIEDYIIEKEDADENIINYTQKIDKITIDLNDKEKLVADNKILLDSKRTELLKNKEIYKSKFDEFNNSQKEITSLENKISNNTKSVEQHNQTLLKLNNNIQNITSNIAKSVGYLEDLENEKAQVELKLKESEHVYSKNLQEKENLEKEISELRIKEFDEKSKINNVKNKIEFFQNLINNLEGVSKGSKALIESEGWTTKDKFILADVGLPKEEYRSVVETILKNVLNNILIETFDELKSAINYLKKNQLGKAYFLLKENTSEKGLLKKINSYSISRKIKKIEKTDDFISWTDNLIEVEPKWKEFFSKSLEKTAIVKSLESAFNLIKIYPEFNFITLDGDYITNNGIVEAGSADNLEDSLFGRRKLLEELKNEYPKLENSLLSLRNIIDGKEESASKINLKVISDQGKILINEINNIEKQISQLEYEKSKAANDIENIQNDIQENVSELNSTETELTNFISLFEVKKNEIENFRNELNDFEGILNTEEDDFSKFQSEYNSLRIELERLKGENKNLNNLLNKARETSESLSKTIEKLHKEIENSKNEITSIESAIEDSQLEHDEINSDKITNSEALVKIEQELISKKNISSELEHNLNSVRNERQNISDRIHHIQVKENEISIRLENLVNHIKDEYAVQLERKEFEDIETYNFNSISAEVHSFKEKLKNLGPINLLAYSEYEEENERLKFLEQQRTDLVNSEKDLISTIKEINESAEKVFMETFSVIKDNFIKIFQSVFNPGDEADLILEEGVDPLEAKIEIIAKPKGKRPTGIELLSGGEKTLTATALLFAIYLVKPSPFCIMDEVDAPLDDANIDRFTKLLKDFSDNTQFIIVTHNKRTMEAAENMYGVTIQEEGISKLVGVQFNQEISVSA
ncbi:MAG: chromosome segregation protein SMC [Ignavibacteriales bacterium]|nr:chromosome segregation protein SMC [Ignavibacteriales bacterium]